MGVILDTRPVEHFKESVEAALVRQQVRVDELTAYYLVNLLCHFVSVSNGPQIDNEPMAFKLGRVLEAGGSTRIMRLRGLGDLALFLVGFFSDSLKRKSVDVDYYAGMGSWAYQHLARHDESAFAPVFGELGGKFVVIADVLSEVSEASNLTSTTDRMRLYERALRGSKRSAELLVRMGIVSNFSVRDKFIQ